jgi:hypothetical protein
MKNGKKPDDFDNVPTAHGLKSDKPKSYVVAPGKSFIAKRGIRVPGDSIIAEELNGGAGTFKDLLEKGYIIEAQE